MLQHKSGMQMRHMCTQKWRKKAYNVCTSLSHVYKDCIVRLTPLACVSWQVLGTAMLRSLQDFILFFANFCHILCALLFFVLVVLSQLLLAPVARLLFCQMPMQHCVSNVLSAVFQIRCLYACSIRAQQHCAFFLIFFFFGITSSTATIPATKMRLDCSNAI